MSDDPDSPDTRRALLALLCVFGLVAASAAAPALAAEAPLGGLDSPQAPSQVPEFLRNVDALNWLFGQQQSDTPVQGGSNTFGALDLGDGTSVGGPISESQRQQAATPHFVGTASERTYWRTGAFIEYTGVGWEDKGDLDAFDQYASVPNTETSTHRVELKRPASALPLVWRPASFQPDCESGEEVCDVGYFQSETGGLSSTTPLDEGAAYRIQSQDVPRSEEVLESAEGTGDSSGDASTEYLDQSSSVNGRYERVATTSRVRELASRVTSDAETKYDAVQAVESYLESEKTYSLSDVPQPGENVVDQFLFEQDKGYCEYFASSMVVMLRTQDIPARYVVGYAGGERVGDDRYLVRGADAHAWVEVYFENVGWVRFDPTPAAPRQAADERLRGSSAYSISLNQTATPGDRVTATVTAAGTPTPGVEVSVNGERVGRTDEDGEVEFTVPYDEELNVTVRPRNDADVANTAAAPGGEFAASVPPPTFAQDDDENATERSFPVDADVSFRFDDDVEPGSVVTMQAFVGGNEFPNAEISVAGERVGRTDENGHIRVRIPEDASGVIELTASRDELSETETYPVDGLTVSVSPSLLAPMPWTSASAHVTSGGEPVADALVTLNGEVVGRTDESGELSFEIPVARVPEVAAASNEKSAVTYVDGVLPTFAVVVLAVLGALGAVVVGARRSGVTVDAVVAAVTRAVNEVASLAVRGVVNVADALADLSSEFREATRDGWRGVLDWVRSLPGRFSVPSAGALVAAVLAALRGEDATTGDRSSVARGSQSASTDESSGRLQAVWQRFVGLVGVERWETKTPAEVARQAVRSGFPERPVYALTSAFRDAAYGEHSENENAERAQHALDELEDGDGR